MTYPRIYSLSTVGVLRHYNQDYLVHKTRTDFTGSNGIGKSMIADFLQIIFIPYRKLIKFGTEGINDGRRLSDLPYQMSEAYVFLNIEVSQDSFITVGTCISQSEQRSPTPFLILNDVDTHKALHDLSFSKEHVPIHTHFVEDNRVVDLAGLAKHFRDKYQLDLNTYGTREKKNAFFSFLFNQEILPINLSIEDNLKAFAKVIQSFSRAKSLDVNDSKSLKAFLFEDEGAYDEAFRKHKDDLQRLLLDYKQLEQEIEILEQKQTLLSALKKREETFKDAEKQFVILDYKFAVQAMNIVQEKWEKAKQELEDAQRKIARLEKRKPKLERLMATSSTQINKYKSALEVLRDYADKYKELQRIQSEISELTAADAPSMDETIPINEEAHGIDVNQLEHREILQRIEQFKLVYERYGSFIVMEAQYHQQYEKLDEHKMTLRKDIQGLEKWIELFTSDKGLLTKVLEQGKSLSEEQEAALFYLLDVHWQKPEEVKEGERFTETLQVLDIDNIEIDEENMGFWLKLGHLREFLPKRSEQLLSNPDAFEQALGNRLSSLEKELETKKAHLAEIIKFERGELSSVSFIELDSDLRDATSFSTLRQSAILIQNIDQKIDSLHSQTQIKSEALQALKEQIPFVVRVDNVEKQRLQKQKVLQKKEMRHKTIFETKVREDERHESLGEILQSRMGKHESEGQSYKGSQLTVQEKENELLRLQIRVELDEQESISKEVVSRLENTLKDAQEAYQDQYRDICKQFRETRERNAPEINEQIDKKHYEFPMLELVLLGPKIKYVDNLPDVLRESNRQRDKIKQSIHTSMLGIFSETRDSFNDHERVVRGLNRFFRGKRISGKYAFHINFTKASIDIGWIDDLSQRLLNVHQLGGLPFGESVESFVEDFFKQVSGYKRNIDVYRLLDPKTYFDLSVSLRDDNGKDYSGSTGEAYSAIVLLGIGRLSRVQKAERKGLRFVILEETANLDQTNFNHFPEIARDFGYQIITMTPRPYGSDSDEGWYHYHLLASKDHADINSEPLGYFKTNRNHQDLQTYLEALENSR